MKFIRPNKGRITSRYGKRIHPVTGELDKMHWGTDFGADGSDDVIASADGEVRVADTVGTTGFGKYVVITHPNGWETLYAHLSSVKVKLKQNVKQGALIGVKGSTGKSTGKHLHFEMCKARWNNKYTTHVDPMHYISDPECYELQDLLASNGHKLKVDGIYGDETRSAIVAFQKANRLTADGIAGAVTMALLRKNAKKEEVAVSKTRFTDVKESASAYEAIERLAEKGILNGYPDGTFRPDEPLTRAHLAVILDRALKG